MIISDAITSVYSVIAVWIPVTVVPTSLATVAIDTFITELSSVIRNWPAASVSSTIPEPVAARSLVPVTRRRYPGRLMRESSKPDDGALVAPNINGALRSRMEGAAGCITRRR